MTRASAILSAAHLRAIVWALCMTLLLVSCASLRKSVLPLQIPFEKSCVYVPVFVDNTDGSVAHKLTDAINYRLYRDHPEAFSYDYRKECVVIDGTVLEKRERVLSGEVEVEIEASALAKTREARVLSLGKFTSSARYAQTDDEREQNKRRTLALRKAASRMAEEFLRALGRAP